MSNQVVLDLGEAMAIDVQPTRKTTTKKKPPTKQRRVVVTEMVVVTPLDMRLMSSITICLRVSVCFLFNLQRIAGEIKYFSTDGWTAPKLSKRMDKFILYSLTTRKKALQDCGVTKDVMEVLHKTKCRVLIGSTMGRDGCVLIIQSPRHVLQATFVY